MGTHTHAMRCSTLLALSLTLAFAKEEQEKDWKKKDIRDYTDADMHKLLEQWDEDEEPIPADELPDGHPDKPRPPIDMNKLKSITDPDQIMQISKGQTVMLFVKVTDFTDKEEVEEITSLWQTGLMNNHVSSDRFQIEDDRVMFLFHDGADAWDAKDFFLEQERCDEVQLEQKTYYGKFSKSKPEEEKEKKEEEGDKKKKKKKKKTDNSK